MRFPDTQQGKLAMELTDKAMPLVIVWVQGVHPQPEVYTWTQTMINGIALSVSPRATLPCCVQQVSLHSPCHPACQLPGLVNCQQPYDQAISSNVDRMLAACLRALMYDAGAGMS